VDASIATKQLPSAQRCGRTSFWTSPTTASTSSATRAENQSPPVAPAENVAAEVRPFGRRGHADGAGCHRRRRREPTLMRRHQNSETKLRHAGGGREGRANDGSQLSRRPTWLATAVSWRVTVKGPERSRRLRGSPARRAQRCGRTSFWTSPTTASTSSGRAENQGPPVAHAENVAAEVRPFGSRGHADGAGCHRRRRREPTLMRRHQNSETKLRHAEAGREGRANDGSQLSRRPTWLAAAVSWRVTVKGPERQVARGALAI
jgi:hypothetical protein